MEAKATARFVRMAPRKVRFVLDTIRGKYAAEALDQLKFTPNHAADEIANVVKSAVANAEHNYGMSTDYLKIVRCYVDAGPTMKRVGLLGLERVPVREGAPLVDAQGRKLGHVTSGTLAPTVNQPIAMAYLAANHALPSHEVYAEVRNKRQPMRVTALPFAQHRYHRG